MMARVALVLFSALLILGYFTYNQSQDMKELKNVVTDLKASKKKLEEVLNIERDVDGFTPDELDKWLLDNGISSSYRLSPMLGTTYAHRPAY